MLFRSDGWRLDKIFEAAESSDVYIQLNLLDMSSFAYNWDAVDQNIFNSILGGPCANRWCFITDTVARDYNKQLWRYIIARYGYSTNLVSWEFWNEVNEIQWSEPLFSWNDLGNWYQDMYPFVESMDPNNHMMTSSVGSRQTHDQSFFAYSQMHIYPTSGVSTNISDMISDYSQLVREVAPDKPNIIGEFGGSSTFFDGTMPDDTTGLHIHNALWTGIMNGLATTPLNWYSNIFYFRGTDKTYYPDWWKNYKAIGRSEERRGGKECRSRWSP